MPHLIVEYSANIEDQIALDALLDKHHTCALGTGVFPLGGLRVRAHRTDAYRIADKSPGQRLRARHGADRPRPPARRAAARGGGAIRGAARSISSRSTQRSPLALSLNVQEFHPVLNFKKNNLHEYVKRRAPNRPS